MIRAGTTMEKGVQRWLVDISKWEPSPRVFSFALSLLPQHEHPSVLRFVRMEDRKRTLVSRLLQYGLVCELLGIPFEQVTIERTSEGKPYLEYGCGELREFPNFNFNTSHHGDYVLIASEPLCLVGLDIVSYKPPQKETIVEFIQNFTSYFSSSEWNSIMSADTSNEVLVEFYRYWCLKEAFVKAIGGGVAFDLRRLDFHHTNWKNIYVKIDGVILEDWKFWLQELGTSHCVAIARGHPRLSTESYKRTLKEFEFNEEDYLAGLNLPNTSFVLKTVEELVSILESSKS
ncbi:hypothetical protein SAY86_030330 [Trapa natans]|uniref:holo-[acyl-carrier-protein] synthase n=1 Tax=Trapa natans TaxID=22666 RepID=A0AAN7RAH8_TRANT|nr:hypothetical protein SAY86_030330 [Trapa natans]